MRFILIVITAFLMNAVLFGQLDTASVQDNTWVSIIPAGSLPINGSNWAYENDFGSHPFFGFFIMGPGHVIHPQDNKFYPYNPVTNKWTILNPPFRSPRDCMSSFSVSSQDTAILHFSGSEGGHQLSNGFFAADYKSILHTGTTDVILTAYRFNNNRLYWMKGPAFVRNGCCQMQPRYDPVHDVTYMLKGGDIWLYNFHHNKSVNFPNSPYSFSGYLWAVAADTRRGRCYVLDGAGNRTCYFDPETGTWTQISGTSPPTPDGTPGIGNIAYDPLHDVIVCLAGGSQTWALNCRGGGWSQVSAAAAPPGRGHLAFNPALNLFMSLGGSSDAISRGGTTQGCWVYRVGSGPTDFDSMARAPDASISLSGGTVGLSWRTPEAGVSGYNVYRADADPFPKGFVKLNGPALADTFYTDASAVSATRYSYRVRAVKGGVEGHWSRHLYTAPGRPMGPAASVESANLVKISWEPNPEPDLTGYHVYRAVAAGIYDTSFRGYTRLTSSPVTGTEYQDNVDLSDGLARGYVVTAVNQFGIESGWSPAATTFPGPCEYAWAFPMGTNFALRWQPPARTKITGVNLYRCCDPPEHVNGSTLITDSLTLWPMPPPTGTTGAELMGKTYVIRAVNVLGQEGFLTDQFSPNNNDYGFGIPIPAEQFKYNDYFPGFSSVEDHASAGPVSAMVLKAWPNPFNPVVNVRIRVDKASDVAFAVFSLEGRLVRSMDDKALPGTYSRALNFSGLPSGVYMVRVAAGDKTGIEKVIYIK